MNAITSAAPPAPFLAPPAPEGFASHPPQDLLAAFLDYALDRIDEQPNPTNAAGVYDNKLRHLVSSLRVTARRLTLNVQAAQLMLYAPELLHTAMSSHELPPIPAPGAPWALPPTLDRHAALRAHIAALRATYAAWYELNRSVQKAAAKAASAAPQALDKRRAQLQAEADRWADALATAQAARERETVRRLLEQDAPTLAKRADALGLDAESLRLR